MTVTRLPRSGSYARPAVAATPVAGAVECVHGMLYGADVLGFQAADSAAKPITRTTPAGADGNV